MKCIASDSIDNAATGYSIRTAWYGKVSYPICGYAFYMFEINAS